ncbi:Sulfurtransferase TusD [Buchnera aphidicola (Thelaxes suberi)]|uniref:sulfurtransferase complex subunit TusD n=1 Tax=Buchnera aphidicola TaxID=9 RepID=UPI0034648A18
MQFVIMVSDFFLNKENSNSAFLFACSLLKLGHKLNNVFFYFDAVLHANNMITTSYDQINLGLEWNKLSINYNFPIYVCSKTSIERGIVSKNEVKSTKYLNYMNMYPSCNLIGYTEWLLLTYKCDRIIQF